MPLRLTRWFIRSETFRIQIFSSIFICEKRYLSLSPNDCQFSSDLKVAAHFDWVVLVASICRVKLGVQVLGLHFTRTFQQPLPLTSDFMLYDSSVLAGKRHLAKCRGSPLLNRSRANFQINCRDGLLFPRLLSNTAGKRDWNGEISFTLLGLLILLEASPTTFTVDQMQTTLCNPIHLTIETFY